MTEPRVYRFVVIKHCKNCLKHHNCRRKGITKKDDEKNWKCWTHDGRSSMGK